MHVEPTADDDGLLRSVERFLDAVPIDFGGGCSVPKAQLLAALIRHRGITRSVDLGVYRGRSLFPQAIAHQRYTGGVVYGVDPWTAEAAHQEDRPDLRTQLERFTRETDFEAIHRRVQDLRRVAGFEGSCAIVRTTSADAARRFEERGTTFGLVHIDGNHDTARVTEDVARYLPLLDRGGVVVLDDVSWDSVRPAFDRLAAATTHVFERVAEGDDYAVFWNGTDAREADSVARLCRRISGPTSDGGFARC
jgi:predicted O-methyltransferase YrrM